MTEAIRRWAAAGLSAAQVARLQSVQFVVTPDLSTTVPSEVGEAFVGVVKLDATAAGFGWFVDATPMQDKEFVNGLAMADGPAVGKPAETRINYAAGGAKIEVKPTVDGRPEEPQSFGTIKLRKIAGEK